MNSNSCLFHILAHRTRPNNQSPEKKKWQIGLHFWLRQSCWSRYILLLLKSTAGSLSSLKCHTDKWDNTDSMTQLQHYPSITREICVNAKINRAKASFLLKWLDVTQNVHRKWIIKSYFQSQSVYTGKCKIFTYCKDVLYLVISSIF